MIIPNYLIAPEGKIRWVWNLHMTYAIIGSLIMDPLIFAFEEPFRQSMRGWLVFIDIFLCLDMVMSLFTTYKIKFGYEGRFLNILTTYLKGMFVIDALCCFPGMLTLETNGPFYLVYFKLFKVIKVKQGIVNYNKMVESLIHDMDRKMQSQVKRVIDMVSFIFVIFISFHIISCIMIIIGSKYSDIQSVHALSNDPESYLHINDDYFSDSWVDRFLTKFGYTHESQTSRFMKTYTAGYYMGLITIAIIGFGDITPTTSEGMQAMMLLQLLGVSIFPIVMTKLQDIYSNKLITHP
jgi:hypothetical protein